MNVWISWVDPWWWVALCGVVFVLGAIGTGPLGSKQDAPWLELVAVATRRFAWVGALLLPGLSAALLLAYRAPQAAAAYKAWWSAMTWRYGAAVIASAFIGWGLRLLLLRFAAPAVSALLRRWRVEQKADGKTDIRTETGRYETRDYDPRPYFVGEGAFVGLNEAGEPVRLPWALLRETHCQVIGPTRYGKGVLIGNVLVQVIQQGWGAWYFDPKGDDHLPKVLAEQAALAGRRFYILDLVNNVGAYAPFCGGTSDERAQRIIAAYKLEGGGGDADYYKRAERAMLRELCDQLGASVGLKELREAFARKKVAKYKGDEKRARADTAIEDGLHEWMSISSVAAPPHKRSLRVEQLLEEGAVVYVRSRTKGLTVEVARTLLQEVAETAIRVPPKATGKHVLVAIDEARSMISASVVDALTTVAGAGMTIMLGYQSVLDVRNTDDVRLDKDAVESAVNVNCQLKICHTAKDRQTATFVSELTGTKRVLLTQSETTTIGQFGAERWGDQRAFREDEDALISTNTISALPFRVAALVAPDRTAELIWTCWVPYDASYYEKALRRLGAAVEAAPT